MKVMQAEFKVSGLRRWVILVGFFVGVLFIMVGKVQAGLTSCGATMSPTEALPNTPVDFRVDVSNTDVVRIRWIRMVKPFGGLSTSDVSLYRWEKYYTADGGDIVVTDERDLYQLNPGGSLYLTLTISVTDILGSSGNWVVEASDEVSGANPVVCGNFPLSITNTAPEFIAPIISDVSISDITGSSATVNWTTNELATSVVNYDVSPDADPFAFVSNSDVLTSSHSLTLSASIAPETTYYFQICGTDKWGNQGCTEVLSFTTGVYNAPAAEVVVQTVTQTQINVQTNTVVQILRDLSPPAVTLSNKWEKFYAKAPIITGTASDNKVIVAVEYSVDRGKTWRPVEIESRKAIATFSFQLPITEEGNYDLMVRAYDAEGNKGSSKIQTLVIDRLPPLFGATYLSWGPGLAVPITGKKVVTMVGLPLSLSLSAVGGPTKIEVGSSKLEDRINLIRDEMSGLWMGKLKFDEPQETTISAIGIDGTNRETTSDLFEVSVLPAGKITDKDGIGVESELWVMIKNPVTGKFNVWDGQFYQQENPVKVGQSGQFGLVLPTGTYYLQIRNTKYEIRNSDIFTLSNTGLVRADVVLKPKKVWSIGQWKINLPNSGQNSFQAEVAAYIGSDETGTAVLRELWDKPLPDIKLETEAGDEVIPTDWIGKTTIVMVDAPWLPTIGESIINFERLSRELDKARVVWVAAQNTAASLQGIKARSGLISMLVLADKEAELTEYIKGHQLPMTLVIDKWGKVRGMYRGIPAIGVITQIMEE